MNDVIQVVTTTGQKADAERIATALVDQRLAACVQISGPIDSTYWWDQKLDRSEEWLCTAKTHRRLFGDVQKAIEQLHPYETPEILATAVVAGSTDYLKWLGEQLVQDPG